MEFSEQQEAKIYRVLDFLKDYDTLDYDEYKRGIKKGDDMIYCWLCDDDKCAEISIKNLRKGLPKYSRLMVERIRNDGDTDCFELCNVCGKNLNKYLTWYESELDYLIMQIQTKGDIVVPQNAFKIVGLLESTAWLNDLINSETAKEKLIEFINLIHSFIMENSKEANVVQMPVTEYDFWREVCNRVVSDALFDKKPIADTIDYLKSRFIIQLQSTPQASPWVKDEIKIDYPDVCPLTKRPFFMVIEDQNLYPVATYGGPFDSYTIPEKIDYGTDSEDDDEYIVHRYDHDIGGWVDDEAIYLEDFPEQNIEDFKDYLKSISAPVSEPKQD